MHSKWIRSWGILAIALFIAPILVIAQNGPPRGGPEYGPPRGGPEYSREGPRGEIQVTNDWRDAVNVTMWTHRRERIGEGWTLRPGISAFLDVDGERIKVRPSYKIKVGEDWGWVNLGDVGRFRRGVWYVSVRDVWRATHQGGDVPDWRR